MNTKEELEEFAARAAEIQNRWTDLATTLQAQLSLYVKGEHGDPTAVEYLEDLLIAAQATLDGNVVESHIETLADGVVPLTGFYIESHASPGLYYELSGRAQSLAHGYLLAARSMEHAEQAGREDHTGHGCAQDPTLLRSRSPKGAN